MALSASKNYSITQADIIESALRKAGAYDQGEAVSGSETSAAAMALNLMVKFLVTKGADIWLRDEITLFLQPDTKSYALGTTNATTSYVESTLSAAEASGQTVLSITSTTGMTTADIFGIKLDDDTIQWTTVTVDSAIQGTVADALTGDAASGNKVYAYTTTAGRPTKIVYSYRRDVNGFDTEVTMVGESEYLSQSNKSSKGPPVEAWYHPTLTVGNLYVWPVDGGANWDKLVMSAQFYPDDFDAASNNPEFPIEWGEPLVYGLADRLAPEYGLSIKERVLLKNEAESKLDDALNYDVENANVIFTMDVRG